MDNAPHAFAYIEYNIYTDSKIIIMLMSMRRSGLMPASVGRVARARRVSVQVRAASLDVIKMSPLGDRVLIRPKQKEEKSAGGVILTGGAGGNPGMGDGVLTGTVVSVGEDVDVELTAGDIVLFTKYGSSDIETDEGSVSFVAQKSIMAKLS